MTINEFFKLFNESINDILDSEIWFIILGLVFIILFSYAFYKTIKDYAKYKYNDDDDNDKD